MKCNHCNAIVSKSKICPFCGTKLQSSSKGLLIVFAIIIAVSIIFGITGYDPNNLQQTSVNLTDKMAMIDNNRFVASSYQSLLNDIQQECPNYTQQQIADMAAASYMSMKNEHDIKDTYLETLSGIKESVSGGGCKTLKLEQIIAGYAVIRIGLK